jgi:hypothetical protein
MSAKDSLALPQAPPRRGWSSWSPIIKVGIVFVAVFILTVIATAIFVSG